LPRIRPGEANEWPLPAPHLAVFHMKRLRRWISYAEWVAIHKDPDFRADDWVIDLQDERRKDNPRLSDFEEYEGEADARRLDERGFKK
jgi:hypothetical protein